MNTNHQKVKIQKVSSFMNNKFPLPSYATPGSAAMDLYACCEKPIVIPAGSQAKVPTGIAIEIPTPEMVALVFPRSGLASKYGISLSNAVGVIDSDYRGEIICVMKNDGPSDFEVSPGDRIAQLGFFPIYRIDWEEVSELNGTQRGTGGFGSTGLSQTLSNPVLK